MGTRGYRIVRYRGRYWIYYNHYDSYPEHLGAGIVAGVPVDPKEYEGEDLRSIPNTVSMALRNLYILSNHIGAR